MVRDLEGLVMLATCSTTELLASEEEDPGGRMGPAVQKAEAACGMRVKGQYHEHQNHPSARAPCHWVSSVSNTKCSVNCVRDSSSSLVIKASLGRERAPLFSPCTAFAPRTSASAMTSVISPHTAVNLETGFTEKLFK